MWFSCIGVTKSSDTRNTPPQPPQEKNSLQQGVKLKKAKEQKSNDKSESEKLHNKNRGL